MQTSRIGELAWMLVASVALLGSPIARAQANPRFTIVAAGDFMPVRVPRLDAHAGLAALARVVRTADLAIVNLEGSIIDTSTFDVWPAADGGGGWIIIDPQAASALRELGFDVVTRANNHAGDWGEAGLRQTTLHLDRLGIAHAGAGDSLATARSPRFIETAQGRAAVLSVTTTFPSATRAASSYGRSRPRPGVNAIRLTRTLQVDAATLAGLKRARDALPPAAQVSVASIAPGQSQDLVSLYGTRFEVGTPGAARFEPDSRDVSALLDSIRSARNQADFVIVNIHSHEPGNWSETPAEFMQPLARAAIDAGADAILSQGPHQVRGVEVYKGRAILYSLGNFLYQIDIADPVVWAPAETPGYDPRLITPQIARMMGTERWYEGLLVELVFEQGRTRQIRLLPLDLGGTLSTTDKGIPRLATGRVATEVLMRLQRLSKAYGTVVRVDGTLGVIELSN